jgi:protein-S-isoprenylcysteine O-methyltransferase Ste14
MSFLGIIVLVIMDWNSFIYRHWSRFVIAIPMISAGNALAFWGLRTLSLHSTLGLGGELITEGTYRITRNPQYVGDMTVLIGYALMSNSRLTMVSALVGCLCFLLTPFMEEPWLREQFGEEYDEYAQEVPRFLSVRGLRRLWEG